MNAEQQANYQMPVAELIKEASKIKVFNGTLDYGLSSFVREVELILPLFNGNPELQTFIYRRHILTKIQGGALQVIRTLPENSGWAEVKQELVKNFGERESYYNLHHKVMTTYNNGNVSEYFYTLRKILDRLNLRYEFDVNKPLEFSPLRNESLILKTFLNNIHENLASVIHCKGAATLREAFYILEETNMLKRYENNTKNHPQKHYKNAYNYNGQNTQPYKQTYTNNSQHNQSYKQPHNNTENTVQHRQNQSGQYRQNQSGQYRQNQSGQYRQNQSGQYRQNQSDQYRQNQSGQYRQNQSGQYRQNHNQSAQYRQAQVEPMDVDHIQEHSNIEQEESEAQSNFRSPAQTIIYR